MTLISRLLGFVRDVAVAWALGAGWMADVFFVAFKLPNLFRRLFAEGAFNLAFVPIFAGKLETESDPDSAHGARTFAAQAQSGLLLVLLTAELSPASALVIYRFGGQDLPPPPEAASPGVQYIQRSWRELQTDTNAQFLDLAVAANSISPLRRDPEVNIAPTAELRGGIFLRPHVNAQVWDGDTSTVWQSGQD